MNEQAEDDRVPFRPGFPADYPIRPGNLIQLDWRATTRNVIQLWMPENMSSRSYGRLLMILHEDVDYRFDRTPEGWWRHSFEKPGVMRLTGVTRPIHDGVEMSLTIENLTDQDWEEVGAGVCVQFHSAPDFYDPERKRTFYVSGGELRTLEGPYHVAGDGVCHFWGPPKEAPADFSFVGIEAADGRHVLATWWEGARGIGGNCHQATLCIHSNPGFGNIPAGESRTRRGFLYMMPGGMADALARYRDDSTT